MSEPTEMEMRAFNAGVKLLREKFLVIEESIHAKPGEIVLVYEDASMFIDLISLVRVVIAAASPNEG